MCYGEPTKSLEIARSRMTPEAWARFEREFDDFCVTSGMPERNGRPRSRYMWAKWAYLSARPKECERYTVFREAGEALLASEYTEAYEVVYRLMEESRAPAAQPTADRRVTDAYHEKIAIASMTDEQAELSLERWKGETKCQS